MREWRSNVTAREGDTEDLAPTAVTGTVVRAWDSEPTTVRVTVESALGEAVFAALEEVRDDGFDYSLSAEPGAGAKLHFICDF